MARVLGLVNLHSSPNLGEIVKNRSFAALTILGRYSFVDIPLSNLSNSNINTVGILVNRCPRSMIKHMDNAMIYTNNTKLGKTIICYNEQYANNNLYNTDINNIIENEWLIDEGKYKYVVIAPSHIIYSLDFNKVIEEHISSNMDITLLYKRINNAKNNYIDQDIIDFDSDGNLIRITKNLGVEDEVNVSMETYIINIDKLKSILRFSSETSKFFSLKDVINYICLTTKVHAYEFEGQIRIINTLESYMETSLELLDMNVAKEIFRDDWPIYTKTHDTPPAKYLLNAEVSNSYISNGAIIDGKVTNSIICREVEVKKGAILKNSIVLSNAYISEGAELEYVVVDKGAKIVHVKELKGTKEHPLYVGMGDVI